LPGSGPSVGAWNQLTGQLDVEDRQLLAVRVWLLLEGVYAGAPY
jgi:hypothetical protein